MSQTSGRSLYLAKAQSDQALGGVAFSAPATVYVALFSVAPLNGTGGTEATGSGYARVATTNNQTNWPASTGTGTPASKSNGVVVQFAPATGNWSSSANMVAWGLFDALSGGNMLYYAPLGTPAPVLSGQDPTFQIGQLAVNEA